MYILWNRRTRITGVSLLLTCLGVFSCRQKTPTIGAPHYFAEVFVRFLAPENEYKAQFMLFEGDTLETARPLKGTADIRFQGQPMRAHALEGYAQRYERLQAGPFSPGQVFEYRDPAGKQQRIDLEMDGIHRFSLSPTVNKAAGTSLYVESTPLKTGESLLLLFSDPQGNTFSLEKIGPLASKEIALTPMDLAAIPPQEYELYLVKKQVGKIINPTHTVISNIEYYSVVQRVQLVE